MSTEKDPQTVPFVCVMCGEIAAQARRLDHGRQLRCIRRMV